MQCGLAFTSDLTLLVQATQFRAGWLRNPPRVPVLKGLSACTTCHEKILHDSARNPSGLPGTLDPTAGLTLRITIDGMFC